MFPKNLINFVKTSINEIKIIVKIENTTFQPIDITTSLTQGDVHLWYYLN